MQTYQITLEFIAPYRQSKKIEAVDENGKAIPNSQRDAWERENFHLKAHINKDGYVVVPAHGLKKAIEGAASLIGGKVQGKGNRGWASVFRTGLLAVENFVTDAHKDREMYSETNSCDSQGKPGGSRVNRTFPEVPPGTTARGQMVILNDEISEAKFKEMLVAAGTFIGVGTFRPEVGGYKGRFAVTEFKKIKTKAVA